MRKRKPVEPVVDLEKARQMIKVTTVILRDHSHMSYHDASLALAWCWRFTETEEMAEKREAKKEKPQEG